MSNTEWHNDQVIGDKSLSNAVNEVAAERDKLRELLAAFIDATVLKGFEVSDDQWERACLLCGRYCQPFLSWRSR